MRRLLVGLLVIQLIVLASTVFAQSTPTATPSTSLFPNLHGISARLKQDIDKMKSDYISGTITQVQLGTIRDQIKAVRVQELTYFQQNGNGVDLSNNQTAQ